MAYSAEVIHRARRVLESRKAEYEDLQQVRRQAVYEKMPRIREIDMTLRSNMATAAQAAFQGDRTAIEQVKQANFALQKERKALLAANFAPDFLPEGPWCDHCGGTGYIGATMCDCLAALCRQEQQKELALLSCGDHSFGDFRLDFYPETPDPKYGVSPRAIMTRNFNLCKKYAENFTENAGNLLFNGSTGLGKTMLSACIAREATEKGYSVVYETAGNLFAKLEQDRFRPDEESAAQVKKFSACDLLIIDDLGTEMPGNFTVAALYALVNGRLLAGKPMVISTNLNISELRERYSPQIASRLEGNFQLLPFLGNDIRVLKNK